jgi:glycosyltransferase involved in cell wall biosynthesis
MRSGCNKRSISVFLPMFNERGSVQRMVVKARAVLERIAGDYEILIVDDGSTDGSERIADTLAAQDVHVRVIHHPHNLGYGAALRTGFKSASKNLVFYTDCDEPVDLNEIERALARMVPGVDLVIGYRIDRHDTARRWLYSTVYNFLARLLFGLDVRDVNFSFKLIRRTVLQRISLRAGSTFIDGEVLAESVRCGYRMVEIPIEYYPRQQGRSSFDSLSAAFFALREMLGYFLDTRVLARASAWRGLAQAECALSRTVSMLWMPVYTILVLLAFPTTSAKWSAGNVPLLGNGDSPLADLVLLCMLGQIAWRWLGRARKQ